MINISYAVGISPTAPEFVELYRASSLGQYRPLEDPSAVKSMIEHANLLVTAREDGMLVGLARSLTDFGYVAYLADLVVRETHQKRGIGLELIRRTQSQLGERAKVVLVSAPEADHYYPRIGFRTFGPSWVIGAHEEVRMA